MLFLLFKTMRKVLHLSNYACGFSYCAPQKRKNTENSKNSSAEIFFRKKPEKNFSENFPKTQQKLCCIMFFGTHFQIISHIYLNKGKIVGSVKTLTTQNEQTKSLNSSFCSLRQYSSTQLFNCFRGIKQESFCFEI